MKERIVQLVRVGVCLLFCFLSPTTWSGEESTYEFKWLDADKEVYVLQNRKFRKTRTFHLSAAFGITTSGAFADAIVGQLRAGFFINEDWGVTALYSYNKSDTNDTFESVRVQQAVPFVRQVQYYYGAMVLWSPFYAKINTFNTIIYLDWMFGLGIANLTEENNRNELDVTGSTALKTESHVGAMWDVGMRFYLTQTWSMQMNLTAVHYKAEKALPNATEDDFYNNFDFTIGGVISF